MEQEAPHPNHEVASKQDEEYTRMVVSFAIYDALAGQVHKEKIGDAVDDFRRIDRRIVIL